MDKKNSFILHKIEINSIETMSGLFIGTNEVVGWTNQGKTNIGFAQTDASILLGCTSLVIDNDFMDIPVHVEVQSLDRTAYPDGALTDTTTVLLNAIDVNVVQGASAISVGENKLNHWTTQFKNNMGNGNFIGKTLNSRNINAVKDHDTIDMPIQHQTFAYQKDQ